MSFLSCDQAFQINLQIPLMKILEGADNRLEQVMLQEIPYEEPS